MASTGGEQPRSKDWVPSAKCLGIALVATLVTLFFFSPSVMSWRCLGTTHLWKIPECGRAKATLQQLDDPWAPISSPTHQVLAWRLLSPLLWHYLSLPRWLLFAMPYVGCVLTLWLAAQIVQPRIGDWMYTAMATLLFATLPWFFVSTGWLTYFDSWLVLGLLTVAFVPSRWAVGLACLLVPWIDERILLALPACLMIRAVSLNCVEPTRRDDFLLDVAVVVVASLPYPAIRALAWLRGDPLINDYVAKHWQHATQVPWTRYLEGLWSGYRAAWIMIVAAAWLGGRRLGWHWGVALAAIMAITAVGGLLIATDMSRSLMMICPAVLLGIWLWHEAKPHSFRWALPAVAVASLLLPAVHVMWDMRMPIFYAHTEMFHYFEQPMQFFDSDLYFERGASAFKEGKLDDAQTALDTSIELNDRYIPAYIYRAALRIKQNNLDAALRDAESIMGVQPNSPDGLYLRAIIKKRQGIPHSARSDVQQALQSAPANWSRRAEAQQFLDAFDTPTPPQ